MQQIRLVRVQYRCQHGFARQGQVVNMYPGAAAELIRRGIAEAVAELACTDPRSESRDRPRTATAVPPSQLPQPASAGGPGTPGAVPRGAPGDRSPGDRAPAAKTRRKE